MMSGKGSPRPMKRYHFSLGNSRRGSIGFCAAVHAPSRKRAVEALREALPEELKVHVDHSGDDDGTYVEYVEIYLNLNRVSGRSVDEIEED